MSTETAHFLAFLLVGFTTGLLLIRRRWLDFCHRRYTFVIGTYCAFRPPTEDALLEMAQRAGFWRALFDITHWDYRRYLAYPGHWERASRFVADPANLVNLDEVMHGVANGTVPLTQEDAERARQQGIEDPPSAGSESDQG